VLQTLAASYAAAGRFSDAATTAERALRLTDQPALAQMLETEIKLYRAGVARAKGEAN
jgi:hypothetical protein